MHVICSVQDPSPAILYQWSCLDVLTNRVIYGDSYPDIVAGIIAHDAYGSEDPSSQWQRRYAYCKIIAAQINRYYADREQQAMPPMLAAWNKAYPLVVVASDYHLQGMPIPSASPTTNVVVLDPYDDTSFLIGLQSVGVITLHQSPRVLRPTPPPMLAPLTDGHGITVRTHDALVFYDHALIEQAPHHAVSSYAFWAELWPVRCFPSVTFWTVPDIDEAGSLHAWVVLARHEIPAFCADRTSATLHHGFATWCLAYDQSHQKERNQDGL